MAEVNDSSFMKNILKEPGMKKHLILVKPGQSKSFTTWEIIQKLRQLSPGILSPPTSIKVDRTTLEWVRFVAELDTRSDVKRVNTSLDSQTIKLSGFPQNLRVRACEAALDSPRRHDWESFFRDASDMDETKLGERPDTVILSGLPIRWFVESLHSPNGKRIRPTGNTEIDESPSPQVVKQVFQAFGQIRRIDIPMLDPVQDPARLTEYLNNQGELAGADMDEVGRILSTKFHKWDKSDDFECADDGGFGKIGPGTISIVGQKRVSSPTAGVNVKPNDPNVNPLTFKVYIQYTDYNGFSRAMESLRGQKLIFSPSRCDTTNENSAHTIEKSYFSSEYKIEFDRSKHLSDSAVQARNQQRDELVAAARRKLAEARAAAMAAEEQRCLLAEAARIAEERRQAEAKAVEIERAAKKAAREERKRLLAIERCRKIKDQLIRRKMVLDEHRRVVAERKIEAIRLVTALLHRIQERHDITVVQRNLAKQCKASKLRHNGLKVTEYKKSYSPVKPMTMRQVGLPENDQDSTTSCKDRPRSLKMCEMVVQSNCQLEYDKSQPGPNLPLTSPIVADERVLFENVMKRREQALRQRLLQRRAATTQ